LLEVLEVVVVVTKILAMMVQQALVVEEVLF